jgi:hypothetical protein
LSHLKTHHACSGFSPRYSLLSWLFFAWLATQYYQVHDGISYTPKAGLLSVR